MKAEVWQRKELYLHHRESTCLNNPGQEFKKMYQKILTVSEYPQWRDMLKKEQELSNILQNDIQLFVQFCS